MVTQCQTQPLLESLPVRWRVTYKLANSSIYKLYMLQGKIDIDNSVNPVTARTTRPLSVTAVKPRTEAGRSSNSNSFCQPGFLCRCTDRVELTAGQFRQLGHLSNF